MDISNIYYGIGQKTNYILYFDLENLVYVGQIVATAVLALHMPGALLGAFCSETNGLVSVFAIDLV